MKRLSSFAFFSSFVGVAISVSVADVQGPAFQSPLVGQSVKNVTGIVTAKTSNGFYIRGDPSQDARVSSSLNIFSSSASVLGKVSVGDLVSLDGKVQEYRSTAAYLMATEIGSPTNIVVHSSNNVVQPIVLGKDRSPPTQHLSQLDVGGDGFLSVPNNSSRIDATNSTLQPDKYGLDFWESLESELVTIPGPTALGFANNYDEFWVYGDWPVTGKNARGSLTITIGPDGLPDANPETVMIGKALDNSTNPDVALGMTLTDITGIVAYQFGFFYVLPLTAPTVVSTPDFTVPPSTLVSAAQADSCILTFGDYNIENMAPTSAHLPLVAGHIATLLNTPDIMFVQEVQDNSGPTNDGVVSSNTTLTNIVNAIASVSNIQYSFLVIDPVDGADGGEPGGNIRQAYLYRPDKLSPKKGIPAGGSLDAVDVTGSNDLATLTFNPGRIDPSNTAWSNSRKPLAAQWSTASGYDLFTVNVHLGSKGGSSSTQGDLRPPVNADVDKRTNQINLVANFVQSVLSIDKNANILVAGDFNEFTQTRTAYKNIEAALTDIDIAAGIPDVERYTYVFDQNTEELDHAFISSALASREVEFQHVHVNTWAPTLAKRVSDHDPSVGRIRVC
ncbi:DNase I-like protein [Pluteus cervinus]|uniref:DNase I-like protein n=1 Tax=Pluteus cervinus TaxID=181527 RepID=A0ACD3BAY0_9AGAR|nr:DNase I-like protein [Pluteus cervinus]